MTSLQLQESQMTNNPKHNILSRKNRVTDKGALIFFFALLFFWICLWGWAIYLSLNSVSSYQHVRDNATDTVRENRSHTNDSFATVEDLFSSVNSTIQILTSGQLYSNSYLWCAFKCIWVAAFVWAMFQPMIAIVEFMCKASSEYIAHFAIVNMFKLIVTILLLIGILSKYGQGWPYDGLLDAYKIFEMYPAVCSCGVIFNITWNWISKQKNCFKSILRYYLNCRYLLIFRILILSIMIVILTSNVFLFKNMCRLDRPGTLLIWILINLINMIIILTLNNYGKMVIIAASVYHDWSDYSKAISLKQLWSATFIVGKYNFGSAFRSLDNMKIIFFMEHIKKLPKPDVLIKHHGTSKNIASHISECSMILTVMDGQNFEDATINIAWLELKQRMIFNVESISVTVWDRISQMNFICVYALITTWNVEALVSKMTTLAVYFALRGVFNYIITVMDTINFAREFFEIKNKKSYTEMEEPKQSNTITATTTV